MKPQFLIAAPSSNSGKTTVTLGLLRLLANQGFRVQPFKCGPDYLDTKHHTLAAGRPGINLDSFMMNHNHVKDLYARYSRESDISIVEGVMGLFDGARRMEGSSAEIACLLNIPVILVINAKAMAYSVAPLLFGFKNFHPGLKIAGVIFNYVNTESHYQFLKEACEDVDVPSLGYIPVNEEIKIPSRYLGLSVSPEHEYEKIISNAAFHIEKTIDVEKLLSQVTIPSPDTDVTQTPSSKKPIKIAIAKDEAFNFIYHENLEAFKQLGEVIFFSPLTDSALPSADIVYLAGGYPELYLKALSSNTSMKQSVFKYCSNGGKVLAECGGMMYLGKHITDKEGNAFPVTGFLNINTSIHQPKLSLGYRSVFLHNKDFKGHEFHYSSSEELSSMPTIGKVRNAKDQEVEAKIYRKENVIASYIHFYWGEQREFLETLWE